MERKHIPARSRSLLYRLHETVDLLQILPHVLDGFDAQNERFASGVGFLLGGDKSRPSSITSAHVGSVCQHGFTDSRRALVEPVRASGSPSPCCKLRAPYCECREAKSTTALSRLSLPATSGRQPPVEHVLSSAASTSAASPFVITVLRDS